MSLRLLITGSAGQIGWQLQRTLAPLGASDRPYPSRA